MLGGGWVVECCYGCCCLSCQPRTHMCVAKLVVTLWHSLCWSNPLDLGCSMQAPIICTITLLRLQATSVNEQPVLDLNVWAVHCGCRLWWLLRRARGAWLHPRTWWWCAAHRWDVLA